MDSSAWRMKTTGAQLPRAGKVPRAAAGSLDACSLPIARRKSCCWAQTSEIKRHASITMRAFEDLWVGRSSASCARSSFSRLFFLLPRHLRRTLTEPFLDPVHQLDQLRTHVVQQVARRHLEC